MEWSCYLRQSSFFSSSNVVVCSVTLTGLIISAVFNLGWLSANGGMDVETLNLSSLPFNLVGVSIDLDGSTKSSVYSEIARPAKKTSSGTVSGPGESNAIARIKASGTRKKLMKISFAPFRNPGRRINGTFWS